MTEGIESRKGSEMEFLEELLVMQGPSKNSEKQYGMLEEEREGFPQVGLNLQPTPQLLL
jgi:hypothetical protein